jgi:hypothetical protein
VPTGPSTPPSAGADPDGAFFSDRIPIPGKRIAVLLLFGEGPWPCLKHEIIMIKRSLVCATASSRGAAIRNVTGLLGVKVINSGRRSKASDHMVLITCLSQHLCMVVCATPVLHSYLTLHKQAYTTGTDGFTVHTGMGISFSS